MIKRTQSLPLNTIILIIIAIAVLVFLIGEFILQTFNQPTSPHPIPPPNRTIFAQCSEYAAAIETQMGTYTNNSSVQLQMLAYSPYVTSNCSDIYIYQFTLYNGSQVMCGLGSNYCIVLSSSSSGSGCPSPCKPPNCIPGCKLE